MRPKLNYANVMATIAVFIALGGGAYALSIPKNSVGTKQLKSGAVKTKDIHKKAKAPRAKVADQTRGLLIHGEASSDSPKTRLTAETNPCGLEGALVRLNVGQSCVMYNVGPLTFTAHCDDGKNGVATVSQDVSSSADGWYVKDSDSLVKNTVQLYPPPAPPMNVPIPISSDQHASARYPGATVSVGNGTSVITSETTLSVHAAGYDCTVSQTATGG